MPQILGVLQPIALISQIVLLHSAAAALPRQLNGGATHSPTHSDRTSNKGVSPILQQSWDQLDVEQQNRATHVYTIAHSILQMGLTSGKKDLVVHSLGAAMEREGQYSNDPEAMPCDSLGSIIYNRDAQ